MGRYITHASSYTYSHMGGPTLLFGVVAIPIVGFGLQHWLDGPDAMSGELHTWVIYGLAATGIVAVGTFLLNLACAPFRIEREDRIVSDAKAADAAARLQNALNTSPPIIRPFDRHLRKNGVVVAAIEVGPIIDSEGIATFPAINSNEPITDKHQYQFDHLILSFLECDAVASMTLMGQKTSHSMTKARFQILRALPIFYEDDAAKT